MKTGRTQKDVGSNFQHLLHFSRGIFEENYIFYGKYEDEFKLHNFLACSKSKKYHNFKY